MIVVTIFKSGMLYKGFSSEGHADFADSGYDIVCSAVSALTITACNSIEALTESSFTVDSSPDGGYIRCMLNAPYNDKAQLLIQSMELGLNMIENNYGSQFLNVQLIQDEV